MIKLTFAILKKDAFWARIISIMESQHGSPLSSEIQKYLVDSVEWSEVRVAQKQKWINSTKIIIDKICAGGATDSDFALFWIRLWGILSELRKIFTPLNVSILLAPVCRAVDDVVDKFSEDEIIFIGYLRHCVTHLHQDYVQVTPKTKKGSLTGFRQPRHGVLAAIDRIHTARGIDEQNIAIEFAQRIKSKIAILNEAIANAVDIA